LNLSSNEIEAHFVGGDYSIVPVKSIGVFNNDLWFDEFGVNLFKNIIEAKIIYTSTGLVLPLKRYSRSQDKQVLEFAGLHSYTEKSMFLKELLRGLKERLQDEVITRVDVAIDFKEKIPERVIREMRKKRKPFSYKNSNYFKTKSEGKKNYNTNIVIYPKHIKEGFSDEVQRLEFSFGSQYFKRDFRLYNLESAVVKMSRTIKRFCGLEVEILPV